MIEEIILKYAIFILYYLIFINFVTILVYFSDKFSANRIDGIRVDSSTFHVLALFGGIFTTFFIMVLLNNKTTRFTFQFITYIILGVWIYLSLKYLKYFIRGF